MKVSSGEFMIGKVGWSSRQVERSLVSPKGDLGFQTADRQGGVCECLSHPADLKRKWASYGFRVIDVGFTSSPEKQATGLLVKTTRY